MMIDDARIDGALACQLSQKQMLRVLPAGQPSVQHEDRSLV